MKRKVCAGEQAEVDTTKKRKREKKSENVPKKNGKPASKTEVDKLESKLNLSNPLSLIKSILYPHTPEFFQEEHWEKKPLHIKRNNSEYYGKLFDMASFFDILKKNKLHYEIDINVCRYVDGEKETMNGEEVAKASEVKNMIQKQNATVQFHQPQRFSDPLWKMMELLERFFGNHVGANVYITPSGSQGLAPHNDDIEAFVLQVEGKKKWMLYKPLQELSRDHSPDLSPDDIGAPTHEIELEAGDFLYFPRGTVHQAKTVSDGVSTHITLSTYQNNSWGDLLLDGVESALENAFSKDVEFRRGLPLNYLSQLGTGKFMDDYVVDDDQMDEEEKDSKKSPEKSPKKSCDSTTEEFKARLKDLLCRLVDHFDPNTVMDSRSEDFVANRLPPFEKSSDQDIGDRPTATSSIKIIHPDHLRLVVYEEDDDAEFDAAAEDESVEEEDEEMDDEEEEEEEEEQEEKTDKNSKSKKKEDDTKKSIKSNDSKAKQKAKRSENQDSEEEEEEENNDEEDILQGPHVRLLFSVHNAREAHMVGGVSEPNAVKLPLHFGKAISQLLEKSSEYVALQDLPLTDEQDKLELATTLWTEKLISVK